jgi:predicted nucleic acid-binding protein
MMTELLVQPYREGGMSRIKAFYSLLTTYPNLDWIAPDLATADLAAQIRARNRLRTPDALLAATAANAGATGLITNDPIFTRIANFETLVLDQLFEHHEN